MAFVDLSPELVVLASLCTLLAGFVKGAVGFAMPMIMISTLGSILPPETALAALILPTLVTNLWQALRGGWRAAARSVVRFRLYLGFMLVAIVLSAQLVRILPASVMLLTIGGVVIFFSALQLVGFIPHIPRRVRSRVEILVGTFAGLVGGVSGVWGPPLVLFLTTLGTDKREQMRVQGVIYALGAVTLTAAHVGSGVLNRETAPFSVLMLVPALIGMGLGLRVHDRLPLATFRRATLAVLILVGLNLIRRALFG